MNILNNRDPLMIKLNDIKDNKDYVLLKKPSNKVANMYLFWIELYKRRNQKNDINSLPYSFTVEHIMRKRQIKWCS